MSKIRRLQELEQELLDNRFKTLGEFGEVFYNRGVIQISKSKPEEYRQEIKLTVEEVKQLRSILNDLFEGE